MQRVRIDLLSDKEIRNRTCSRFSTTYGWLMCISILAEITDSILLSVQYTKSNKYFYS